MTVRHPDLRLFYFDVALYPNFFVTRYKKIMLLQSFASWEIFLHFINHQLPSQIFKFLEPFVQNLH